VARGEYNEAIQEYRQAIALNPTQAISYLGLGDALVQQGRINEAIATYTRALEIQPKLFQATERLEALSKKRE
jgi:tetratricopeptide (TPR) repeat protein